MLNVVRYSKSEYDHEDVYDLYFWTKCKPVNGFLQVGNTDGLNHQYVFKTVLDQLGLNFKTHDITPDSKNKGLSKYYVQNNN